MPFGIDDALIWGPMIGAAAGGLLKKDKPLQGALIGAGLGLGAGAAAPGLLGAGVAAPGMTGALGAGLTVPGAAAPGMATLGGLGSGLSATAGGMSPLALAGGAGSSSLGMAGLGASGAGLAGSLPSLSSASPTALAGMMESAKPFGQAAMAANSVKSLVTPAPEQQTPLQVSPIAQTMPNNNLGALVQSMEQGQQQQQAQAEQKRMMRRQAMRGLV